MGKEVFAASPHDGTFSSPIWVGKSWTTNFTAHDRIRGFSHSPVQVNWKVESFEDVTVPAGTFKAFRLQSSVPVGNAFSTLWYAPEVNLIVKRIDERTSRHPLGSDKRTTEMIEYHKPTKTAQRSSGNGVWHWRLDAVNTARAPAVHSVADSSQMLPSGSLTYSE
jgi:hypothetical protein